MNDLISRAAAINAICEDGVQLERHAQYSMTMVERKQRDVDILEALPPVSFENHDEIKSYSKDTISRQAAIDVIDAVFPVDPMKSEYAQGIACGAALAKTYVEQLPSAQPEIKERTEEFAQNVPKEDLISRKTAIEAMSESLKRVFPEHRQIAEKCLKALPSAQPEQRWIPCSERLPEDLAEVNVTWVNHEPEPYYDFVKDKPFTASAVYYKGDWYWYSSVCADLLAEYGKNEIDKIDDAIEITAWMPLPEPYQEGEQDENR